MKIGEAVKSFGCHDVVLLDNTPNPKHLDYIDLLKISGCGNLKVDAVAEFQSRPLLYIATSDLNGEYDRNNILDLQCLLANRGERAYLAIMSHGDLNLYPVNLNRTILENSNKITIRKDSSTAPLFFQSVVSGIFTLEGQPEEPDYVFKTIHDLITRSSKYLIKKCSLNPLDVLSLLGRSLFFRFLWDRKIVRESELETVCPKAESLRDCFCNIENSVATCRWLDETFNGDMLPLSDNHTSIFDQANQQTNGKVFLHLQAILEGWRHAGNEAFQLQIDWGDLDFAHIPIGVLSQVYESFSKIWDSHQREQTSAYYTPKNIAGYIVDDAFEGVAVKRDAQILDPSCGAGIFLVMAFRKLVAAHWEHSGKRPDTKTIQTILYNQLCGFDVSESALRLAALSLYITAIELNQSPRPPKSLKFPKPLQGIVLYNHRRPEERDDRDFVLGSLHPDQTINFNGRFDLVIGNPPWSRLLGRDKKSKKKFKAHNILFTKLTRQILIDRGLGDIAKTYHNPNNNPDLPFLWKSIQWTKPGGIIAMALPGRIFLKQTASGTRAFKAILKGIEISGILNGSNLSDSAVWPDMNQPFMLLFARNRVPDANHHFHFVTPYFEKHLNDKGRLRIDYQSAQPVSISEATKDSRLLKTLSMGTALDVDIMHKLDDLNWVTVKSYWKSKGLYSGLGYNRSPNSDQFDASFMLGLPDFAPPQGDGFSVNVKRCKKFGEPTAHRPRDPELYLPPLLIVPESPGPSLFSPKSWVVRDKVVFSKSYYGFTAHSSNDADWVIALLHLITHSKLFKYHVLMTSSRMGAERRTFLKENIEHFPFPTSALVSKQRRKKILELSNQLEFAPNKPWELINDFIFDLYGLDEYDRQVVEDTLAVAAPFKESRNRSNQRPEKTDRIEFYSEIKRLLKPSFEVSGESVLIHEIEFADQAIRVPWHFFTISSPSISSNMSKSEQRNLVYRITEEANKTGCSRVIVHEKGRLLLGIIGQYRYWTLSRARMCALYILRHHLDSFPLGGN